MIPEFTVPHLPKPFEAYRLQRPHLQRRVGISDAQYAADSKPYFDAVLAIDVYLLQEAEQYRYWFECGDTMEMNACVRAMENAAYSRYLLTLSNPYLAWSVHKDDVVTDRLALLTLPEPPKVEALKHVEITPVAETNWFGDGHWLSASDGDARARALFERHYSCYQYKDGRKRTIFVGPGEKMVLMTMNCDSLFVWRKFISADGQQGVNCAVFRNESTIQSSDLIREACEFAWKRWPGERLYTYVKAEAVKSSNPGYCFIKAGWQKCGITKVNKLLIFELLPEPKPVEVTIIHVKPRVEPAVSVPVVINGQALYMGAGDHIAMLTGTVARFEQGLEPA